MIKKNFLLSVAVLFWNNSDKTIKCLDSIFKQRGIPFELILVDNNFKQLSLIILLCVFIFLNKNTYLLIFLFPLFIYYFVAWPAFRHSDAWEKLNSKH